MKAIFRQQIIQVIAGDAARDVGKFLADETGVLIGNICQTAVDLATPSGFSADPSQIIGRSLPDFHAHAVVGDDFEFFDVVVGLSRHHRVDAAGIVSDHAPEGAAVVGCRVGCEGQMIFFGGVAEMIENDTGLDASDAAGGINLQDCCHVLGKIQHDGDVAALARQRCAAAPAKQGCAKFAADRNCGEHVICIVRKNNADRNLAIVRAIGRIKRAAAVVEADFAANARAQNLGQSRSVFEQGF